MRWLIDSDVLIEGERGNATFVPWLESQQEIATADVIRGEFLLGVHAVSDVSKRQRGELFYRDRVSQMASLASESTDYESAARLAGEARRTGKARPSLVDGLLAAIAFRVGAKVATRNTVDFNGMGCPCENPFKNPPVKLTT